MRERDRQYAGVRNLKLALATDTNAVELASLAHAFEQEKFPEAYAALYGEEALTNLHGHTSPITGLLFLDDAATVISSSWDRTLRIWKLPRRLP